MPLIVASGLLLSVIWLPGSVQTTDVSWLRAQPGLSSRCHGVSNLRCHIGACRV